MVLALDKWNRRYMSLALEIAGWSKDPSSQVGAVAVSPDKRKLTVGYNGLPTSIPDSPAILNDKELKNQLMLHAEINCVVNATQQVSGWTLYVTKSPCLACAKIIVATGIATVVCPSPGGSWADEQLLAIALFKQSKTQVEFI